jgi:hypothetical protein
MPGSKVIMALKLIAGTASAAMNLKNLRKDTDAVNKDTHSAGAPKLWLIPMRFLAVRLTLVSAESHVRNR